jgi:hypothetical protein
MVSLVPLVIALPLHNVPEQNVNDETSQSDMSQMYKGHVKNVPRSLTLYLMALCVSQTPFLNVIGLIAAKTYLLTIILRSSGCFQLLILLLELLTLVGQCSNSIWDFIPIVHPSHSEEISPDLLVLWLGCALTFASEAKFEIEAKISFRLEAKKKPYFT